jgi:hypothetical protein
MTSQSPRIYTYKITFEEVPYYYYGVHKERRYDEEYWGSPYTHKWCWEFYTPKKQILEFFDYSDDGWLEAQEVEAEIIRSFFNVDKWCLNENVSGIMSLKMRSKAGLKTKENGTGIFSITPEKRSELSREIGLKSYKNGTGVFSLTSEQQSLRSRKAGLKTKENGTGIFSIPPEEKSERSRRTGLKHYENGTGFFSLTPEEKSEIGRRSGLKAKENGTGIHAMTLEQRREHSNKTLRQIWMCLETGFTTNPGALTLYQRKRGIDTSKRKRIG